MKQSQRLGVVLALEQRKEQTALEALQQAQAKLQHEQQRLEELERYHREYQEQARSASHGQISVSRLQSWQYFINQLTTAMGQQQRQIERAGEVLAQSRQLWQQAWERREGMARFIATCRERERQAEDRSEQKAVDEAAGLRFARRQQRRR
ncbi:MAG: flagellar export protein FliJ [Halomonadaceae bacterium]|nr:MAG: flagellar export protein FliJ [Halomonadaceae bacterium]